MYIMRMGGGPAVCHDEALMKLVQWKANETFTRLEWFVIFSER